MGKYKKERDIVKLLYEENKEYELIKTFCKAHMRKYSPCRIHCSKEIEVNHGLPLESFGNALCSYIEYLESKNNGKA